MKKKPGDAEIPVWRRVPLLRLLIPWMLGIIVADNFIYSDLEKVEAIAGILFIINLVICIGKSLYSREKIYGIILCVSWLLCGYVAGSMRRNPPQCITDYAGQKTFIKAEITDKSRSNSGWKLECKLTSFADARQWKPAKGSFILRIDSLSSLQSVQIGDAVELYGSFNELMPSEVPYSFNYAQTQARKGIYFQFSLYKNNWSLIHKVKANPLIAWINFQRENLETSLIKYIPGKDESAVAVALLVGDDDAIEQDTMRDYSTTGTLHVLSVSGMHVGLIYLLIAALLRPLEKRKGGRPVYFILVIILVWLYAMIAACSPPVLRSALMLTIALLGKWLRRKSALLNSIVISLFMLLLWDPSLLFNTGLQLSYLAVTGIVLLQPVIASNFHFENKIMHWFSEFLSVSLAAQLSTCGISLFVFHQFPDLFLFSNMVVIPLSSIAIYASLAVSVLAAFPIVAVPAGEITGFLIHLTNSIVHQIAILPFAASTGIWISVVESLLLYILLFTGVKWLLQKRFQYLFASLAIVILLQCSLIIKSYNHFAENNIYTYHFAHKCVVVCTKGKTQLALFKSSDDKSNQKIKAELNVIGDACGIKNRLILVR